MKGLLAEKGLVLLISLAHWTASTGSLLISGLRRSSPRHCAKDVELTIASELEPGGSSDRPASGQATGRLFET
jgi:hypothetical protein